jgi:hypothetical protein
MPMVAALDLAVAYVPGNSLPNFGGCLDSMVAMVGGRARGRIRGPAHGRIPPRNTSAQGILGKVQLCTVWTGTDHYTVGKRA